MYKLNYDFKEYNDNIILYIKKLLDSSIKYFQPQITDRKVLNIEYDSDSLVRSFHDIEEYLHYLFTNSPDTFSQNYSSIANKVKIIAVLIDDKRGIYSHSIDIAKKIIYINPDLFRNATLTSEERTKLYLIHEIGHVINSEWMNKVKEYANQQLKAGTMTQAHAELIIDGFTLIDEATAQNRAENFIYQSVKKQRNPLSNYSNEKLFDGQPYKSNFDYLSELQEPAIMFSRTLNGIERDYTDEKALDILSEKALSPEFFDKVLDEYKKENQMELLLKEVQFMGLLKKASYANLGFEDSSYLKDSKSYLQNLKSATTKMRDFKHPIYAPQKKWKFFK